MVITVVSDLLLVHPYIVVATKSPLLQPRTRTTFATLGLASLARNTSGQTSVAKILAGDAASMKLSRFETYKALKRAER